MSPYPYEEEQKWKAISLANAQVELAKRLYEVAALIKELEDAGRISGNGQHLRQSIAEYGKILLKESWK